MSATTSHPRHPRLGPPTRGAPAGQRPTAEISSDHNYLTKIMISTFLVVLSVVGVAQFGWAILPVAFLILLATTAGVLHATGRLLAESANDNT
jgi:hypothetical protein